MSLMIWISQATGWAVPDIPKYVFLSVPEMTKTAYECEKPSIENEHICSMDDQDIIGSDALMKPLALYDTRNETIMLPLTFDIDSPKDQSILLHELVHYIQWHNKLYPAKYDCRQHTEKEAYDLQEKFLLESGMDIHEEIKIGKLLRFMLTSCDAGMSWGR